MASNPTSCQRDVVATVTHLRQRAFKGRSTREAPTTHTAPAAITPISSFSMEFGKSLVNRYRTRGEHALTFVTVFGCAAVSVSGKSVLVTRAAVVR